jgi:hypothetical protein
MKKFALSLAALVLLAGAAACESSDPDEKPLEGAAGAAGEATATCEANKGTTPMDNPSCQPLESDYRPRDNASKDDAWAACISDDNVYHPFNQSVGSNARAAAFEEMAILLGFGGGKAPSPDDFLKAKVAYSEPEGLQSRISRREDVHYPAAPKQCRDLTGDELKAFPDRCVSQNRIQPLVETALNDGALGKDPVLNAARVEAGILWFFYISIYKEIETCGLEDKEDCDSATGYYGGVQTRTNPIGFARYVLALSPQAHDRVWDGLLAARCWRELDPELPSKDDKLRLQAMDQADRATMRGLALLVRERLQNAPSCGVAWETAKILGTVLLREARVRDAASAAVLEAQLTKPSAAELDVKAASDALDAIFPCP